MYYVQAYTKDLLASDKTCCWPMKNGKRLVFEAQLRFLIPRLRKFVELIKVKTCKQEEPKQKRLSLSTKDTVTASFQMKKKEFHTGFTPQQRPHLIWRSSRSLVHLAIFSQRDSFFTLKFLGTMKILRVKII